MTDQGFRVIVTGRFGIVTAHFTLKVSKGVVAKYVSLASAAGLDWETVQDWSEKQLGSVLLPRSATAQPFVEPDWARVHRELDRKGMTLMLLWQEYVAANP